MSDQTNFKYVTGMRTTVDEQQLGTAADIVEHIKRCGVGYEVIDGACIPYMDFDFKYDDDETRETNEDDDVYNSIEAVRKEYPKGKVYYMVANGYSMGKDKYVNSIHAVVRGVGYFNSGEELFNSFSPSLQAVVDRSVYKRAGKRQLFRMVGCSKEGEQRPFILEDDSGETYSVDNLPRNLGFKSLLIQNVEGEQLCKHVAAVPEKPKRKVPPANAGNAVDTNVIGTNEKKLRELIALLVPPGGQDWSWDEWKDRMWAIRNVADLEGCDLFPLALEVSNQRIGGETDDVQTRKIYNAKDGKPNDKRAGFKLGSLCMWAKEVYPAEYLRWRVKYCTQKYYYSDIASLISQKPVPVYELIECLKQTCLLCEVHGKNVFYTKNLSPDGVVVYTALDRLTPLANTADFNFEIPGKDDKPFKTSVNAIYGQHVRYQHRYKYFEFKPYLIPPQPHEMNNDTLNTFGGWRWKFTERKYEVDEKGHPIPPDCIKPWIDHIKNKICIESDLVKGVHGYQHLGHTIIQWFAHILQCPTQKPWALVMKSVEGGGKGVLKEYMEYVYSTVYCATFSSWAKICGQFNGKMDGKMLQCLNEATNFPTNQQKELMKAMIKDIDLSINRKFMAEYEIKSYVRTMITTNNRRPVAIDYDDRRYACVDAKEDHINDKAYFDLLHSIKYDENSQHEMFDFLCNYPLDGFNAEKPPMTLWKQELIGDNLRNEMTFMRGVLNGEIDGIKFVDDELRVRNQKLYDTYTAWVTNSGENKASSSREFAAELKRNGFVKKTVRINKVGVEGYKICKNELQRKINQLTAH